MLKKIFTFILILGIMQTVSAQETVAVPKDSIAVKSEHIKKESGLKKLSRRLFFKRKKGDTNNSEAPVQIKRNLELGEGKIIRNIKITTLDPFGFSESDTTKTPTKSIEQFGNRMHLKTKAFTIRNFLMFKKEDRFDSLLIKESERLIRTQHYVRRVMIKPIPLANNPDSVDVSVRVLDSWSIYPTGSLSNSSARIQLIDRNFGGFGHEFSNQYKTRFNEGKNAYSTQYRVNNIAQTFISTSLVYDTDLDQNYIKSWSVQRPFYSPYAKWAGGAQIYQRFYRDSLPDINQKYSYENFKYNIKDFWIGYSLPIAERFNKRSVITNLITSIRFFRQKYTESPSFEYDTLNYFSNQKLYLASIGISSINYVQDRYIFNHDIIEDVQVGKIISLTGGIQEQYGKRRSYFGAKFSYGQYIRDRKNYFSTQIEWGSYYDGGAPEQGAIIIEGVYFSSLRTMGNWKYRSFIRPQFVIGYNRMAHVGDELRIDTQGGIEGYNASKLRGTKRGILTFQLQSYAPTQWNGFRFNPYFNAEIGMLSDHATNFFSGQVHSKIGIGVVINNDYLVFSNIQLSLAYYPKMPDRDGNSVIKTNSLRNKDFNLQDFNYGKPGTVPYR